jgi:mannosyltransferase
MSQLVSAIPDAPSRTAAAVDGPAASATPSDASRSQLFLIGILAAAAMLDMLFLGTRSFWLDESISVKLARLDWRTLPHALWSTGEVNMVLYYGLLHEWIRLGDSEAFLRTLSVLMAIGSIGAVYLLGKRMFGGSVALLAALLLVLNTYQIRYAQEARGYSLVMLLVTLASLAFLQALARPTRRSWTVYTLTSVLAVYAHFFAVFVFAAHWLSAGLLGRRHAAQKGLGASMAVIGLLLSPIALFAATAKGDNIGWIPKPTVQTVHHLSCALTGGGPWGGCPSWDSSFLIAFYAAACALALVAGVTEVQRTSEPSSGWRYVFLLMWLLVPIGLALGVSTIKPIFVSRYFVVCLPPLVLLASVGMTRLHAPWAMAIMVAVFVAAAGYQDVRYYARLHARDWRGATAYVLSRRQPGDAMFFSPWYLQHPYDYYRARSSCGGGPPVVPRWERSMGAGDPTAGLLNTLQARYSRVWILYYSDTSDIAPLNPRIFAPFSARSWTKENRDFGGVGVRLYTAR